MIKGNNYILLFLTVLATGFSYGNSENEANINSALNNSAFSKLKPLSTVILQQNQDTKSSKEKKKKKKTKKNK